MQRWLKHYHFQIGLAVVILVGLWVMLANLSWGKFLSGWDTLHPEFNLKLYTQRVIFGAWQEHQGLGAPASQAHLAELPRLPLLYGLTAIFPLWSVRYLFMFSMYIAGGIGMYLFVTKAWFERQPTPQSSIAGTLAALFYLLNLGTLQQFYVPLEMFAVHFATLGFILLATHKAIHTQKQGWYLAFFIAQFLSAPSAHTATLFYMYNVVIFAYALTLALSVAGLRNARLWFTTLFKLGLLTLFSHWYWLIPNLYYILEHSEYVREAKISRLFSNEAFWQNQAYGSIPNVLILKNFLFNWKDYNYQQQAFVDLFDEWQSHLDLGYGTALLFTTSLISLAGAPLLLTRQAIKEKRWPFLIFLVVPFFFLVNYNFPFRGLYGFLRDNSSLLEEGLRFPFTKFSILWMFGLGVALASFIRWALGFFWTLGGRQARVFSAALISLLTVSILGGSQPAWRGYLISPQMKVAIPQSYFELFDWFETQPASTRIVKFPVVTFTGWNYYNWPKQGYQGAGFTWFGLPQPTLDREFDRWVRTDESFYHELAQALRAGDQLAFESLLKKYDVTWLLYDNAIFNPYQPESNQHQKEFMTLVSGLPQIKLARSIGSVDIYQVAQPSTETWLKSEPVTIVNGATELVRNDAIYQAVGPYLNQAQSGLTYPFADLLAERVTNPGLQITPTQTSITSSISGTQLQLPAWTKFNQALPLNITAAYNPLTESVVVSLSSNYPQFKIGQKAINLADFALAPLVTLDLPTSQTEQVALSIDGTFYDLTDLASSTRIGALNFELTQDHQFQLFSVTPGDDETVSVQALGEVVTLSSSELTPLLFPDTSITLSDSNQQLEVTTTHDPETKPLSSYSTSQTVNCNNQIGTAAKEWNSTTIEYRSAKKGNACDRFTFTNLSNHQDYVLEVKGFNTEGMPLKFNVNRQQNATPYLEEMLHPEATTSLYSILGDGSNRGLEFHLASLSFGEIETINTLQNVHFYPVPLTWLANIKTLNEQINTGVLPPLKIQTATRHNASWYSAHVQSDTAQSPLVLSQSYDPGWHAFIRPTEFWKIHKYRIATHTRYNNWGNSWLLPQGDLKVSIIYLPQLGSYLGYALAALSLAYLILSTLQERRHQTRPRSTHHHQIKKILMGRK